MKFSKSEKQISKLRYEKLNDFRRNKKAHATVRLERNYEIKDRI